MTGVKSVYIAVDVYVGGLHDRPGLEGEHHAFEHMPFRGTLLFPNKQSWGLPLERCAADYNASTGRDVTRYHVLVPADAFALGCRHLSEVAFGALLRPEDWEQEREAILREWEQSQGQPSRIRSDMLRRRVHAQEPGMHASILGSPDTIFAITCDDLEDLRRREYGIGNVQLIVAGAMRPDAHDVLKREFGERVLPNVTASRRIIKYPWPIDEPIELRHEFFVPSSVHLSFWHDRLLPRTQLAYNVFVRMLGSEGIASPLFDELREKRGLVYGFDLDSDTYLGVFEHGFSAMCALETMTDVVNVFWDVVERVKRDQDRFAFARDAVLSGIRGNEMLPMSLGESIADELMHFDSYMEDSETEAIVGSLTYEEVVAAADYCFDRKRASMIVSRQH